MRTLAHELAELEIRSLNPFFNGICFVSVLRYLYGRIHKVLILFLMEYAL